MCKTIGSRSPTKSRRTARTAARRTSLGLACSALGLLVAGAAQASLVTNGSFETGDFTGWTPRVITTCCSVFAPSVSASVVATDGTYAANLGNGFALLWVEQAIVTSAAERYRISFDIGILSPSSTNGRQDVLTVADSAGTAILTEVLSSDIAFTPPSSPKYKSYSFEFAALGSGTTIRFATDGYTPFASTFLDNVSVTALRVDPPPSGVSEPGTAWLAAAALAAASLRRRGGRIPGR